MERCGQRSRCGLFLYTTAPSPACEAGSVRTHFGYRADCARELRIKGAENALNRKMAANDALTVLPFFVGERAPTWPENLDGTIVGLTQSSDAAQIFRATTCAVFYRLAQILHLMEKAGGRAKQIIVSGGILKSGTFLPARRYPS